MNQFFNTGDVCSARDLGLISSDSPLQIASPIYREVIARALGEQFEAAITASPHALTLPDGQLDVPAMLAGDVMASGADYSEARAQLVFMAYLHCMVNGDGYLDREFAIGSGRADILFRRRYGHGETQHAAFEVRAWRDNDGDPLPAALSQLDGYLDRFGLGTGTVVIFDRRRSAPPISQRTEITAVASGAGRPPEPCCAPDWPAGLAGPPEKGCGRVPSPCLEIPALTPAYARAAFSSASSWDFSSLPAAL